jgi:NitT/TauT family transport system substrate-binding protein
MIKQGGRRLEAGVIATYLLGDKEAMAITAGAVISGKMLRERPEVAQHFAEAWSRAVKDSNTDPTVRDLLVKYMATDASIAATVTLPKFNMVKDLTKVDIDAFQTFGTLGVSWGVVRSQVDVRPMLKSY